MQSILKKLQHYCAYQERCQQEVLQKMRDLGCYGQTAQEILSQLIEEDFLNEERFARIFAGSKFRQKHWGKQKIKQALQQKQISPYCIQKALNEEIEADDYQAKILDLMEKKKQEYTGLAPFVLKQKIFQYLFSRGFELDQLEQCWQDKQT
jgi:regulatory protein